MEKTKSENRNSKLGRAPELTSSFAFRVSSFAAAFWAWLRDVSEDSAYERYLEAGGKRLEAGLSRSEFYRQRLERKYSRPNRCC